MTSTSFDRGYRPAREWWHELPGSVCDEILVDPEGPLAWQSILAVGRARGEVVRMSCPRPGVMVEYRLAPADAEWILESGADGR